MGAISSPCVGVCRLAAGHCVGCGRSLNQIAQWGRLSEAERRRIMRALERDGSESDAESRG